MDQIKFLITFLCNPSKCRETKERKEQTKIIRRKILRNSNEPIQRRLHSTRQQKCKELEQIRGKELTFRGSWTIDSETMTDYGKRKERVDWVVVVVVVVVERDGWDLINWRKRISREEKKKKKIKKTKERASPQNLFWFSLSYMKDQIKAYLLCYLIIFKTFLYFLFLFSCYIK